MAPQSFNITIEGYWRDRNKLSIPDQPGIFFVYETKYNLESDTVSLIAILYIGESEDVKNGIIFRLLVHTYSVLAFTFLQ